MKYIKKVLAYFSKLAAKITTWRPQVIENITILYKSLYTLDSTLTHAIASADELGLDTSGVYRIAEYVKRINAFTEKVASKLGIIIEPEFKLEVAKTLMLDSTIKSARKGTDVPSSRAKLTFNDVVKNYDRAFDKINSLTKE